MCLGNSLVKSSLPHCLSPCLPTYRDHWHPFPARSSGEKGLWRKRTSTRDVTFPGRMGQAYRGPLPHHTSGPVGVESNCTMYCTTIVPPCGLSEQLAETREARVSCVTDTVHPYLASHPSCRRDSELRRMFWSVQSSETLTSSALHLATMLRRGLTKSAGLLLLRRCCRLQRKRCVWA